MTSQIGSGTVQGLIDFLDQLVEKGRAKSGSVTPLKTATKKVISVVDGEEKWKETDLRRVDVDDYIERFKNLTLGKYTEDSYKAYQSRLNRAKSWYTKFLSNPGWVPSKSAKGRPEKKQKNGHSELSTKKNENSVNETQISSVHVETDTSLSDLIAYPFPLLTGRIVNLYLPVDLTLADAKRLSRFIESLSIDVPDDSKNDNN